MLRVSAISPLIHFLMQTISVSILGDPSTIPLLGYKLLPGLVNVVALLKETFKVHEQGKEPCAAGASSPSSGMNLLDCLQALTSEGIDFTRERVFETPHPYPQNDYSQSETIEVPKAIGFIVELDKRCSAEHSTDQLVMYSGSDHIFQINPSFATQIKMSTKPNTRQPYLLLGSRMKIDFRSYSQRQRRGVRGGPAAVLRPSNGGEAGQRRSGARNPQSEARWGFRVVVRPIYSEPQNIVLSGQVRSAQRKSIYLRLGGEESCHEAEVLLNSLVCLASQFSKEMANIDGFLPIREPGAPSGASEAAGEGHLSVTSVTSSAIQKLAKQQLFRGGIADARLLVSSRHLPAEGGARPRAASTLNYHDLILQELKMQQEVLAGHSTQLVPVPPLTDSLPSEGKGSQAHRAGSSALAGAYGDSGLEECKAFRQFLPDPELWTQAVRDLLAVEQAAVQSLVPQSAADGGAAESRRARRTFRLVPSQLLDKVYAKIRELVQYPIVVRQRFLLASAKKHQPAWVDLEKLMVVALLFHSQSLHLARKCAEIKVPNLRSSGGVFQYGAGLKSARVSDESTFLMDQLKLIGNQLNDMLMWLILRVQGEMDAQEIIQSTFEAAQ